MLKQLCLVVGMLDWETLAATNDPARLEASS